MRMRIARPHHRAAIFEDLHVIDLWHLRQLLELGSTGMDHDFNIFRRHRGEGKVVARGEADYPAKARFTLCEKQSTVFEVEAVVANRRFERRKIIVENKRAGVVSLENPAHP